MLLEVNKLSASYGMTQILHDVDLHIEKGEVCALLGANGAGKTTLLRSLCQLMVTTQGSVMFNGQRIDRMRTDKIARAGAGHVPEGRGTFLSLSTEDNLHLGACARSDINTIEADLDVIYGYFPLLKERRRQQAGTLSGGEQQMLAIGRALMARPTLLMLDEPSFGLAPLVVEDIFDIMRRINVEQSVSILLVEQNANLALELANRAYLLESGRIVFSGTSQEVRENDAVRRAYLGD